MNRKLGLLFAIVLGACGGGDGASDSFDSYVASYNRVIDAVCACSSDAAACEADLAWSSAEISCLRGVVEDNEDVLDEPLNCIADASRDMASCVEALDCTDQAGFEACSNAFEAAADACPEPPADVDAMFEACFPE